MRSLLLAADYQACVRLFSAARKLLLEFGEDETTIMKMGFETPPVHFMVKAPAGVDRAPYARRTGRCLDLAQPQRADLVSVFPRKGCRSAGGRSPGILAERLRVLTASPA